MQLPDMAWQQSIEGLKEICDFANDLGINIGVENMPNMQHIFGKRPGELLGMIESLERENVGLTLDMGMPIPTALFLISWRILKK